MTTVPCTLENTTDGKIEGIFLPSHLKAAKCGETIVQLKNSTTDFQDKLAQLLVLMSRPENLTESDIINALDILDSYANDPHQNVCLFNYFFNK